METKMIGDRIAEARKKINISQSQLAKQLFISPQAVGKWERGESLPDIITLNRLAEILGVDLNYFSKNYQPELKEKATAVVPEREPEEITFGKQLKKKSWDMSRGNWVDADFSGLKNLHEKFSSSNMMKCLFVGSELSGLLLKRNNVMNCDFSGSEINNSHIEKSNLIKNIYKDCSLKDTEFTESNISDCDFTGASFNEVSVKSSFFSGCNFTGADLTGAEFRGGGIQKNLFEDVAWNRTSFNDTWLVDTVFEGKIEECSFENCFFKKVIFQNATLINTFFKNKSLKRISFVDCKADRMTYAFLKNGKADLTGITLIES